MAPDDGFDEKPEEQTTFKCKISDGPFCGPMDKYYRHSKSLYSTPV